MRINNDRTVSEITRAEGSSKETNGRRSRKNYLECRFFSDTKLDFGMKSAEKFITRASFHFTEKPTMRSAAHIPKHKIKFNNKCSPVYNGKFSDSEHVNSDEINF